MRLPPQSRQTSSTRNTSYRPCSTGGSPRRSPAPLTKRPTGPASQGEAQRTKPLRSKCTGGKLHPFSSRNRGGLMITKMLARIALLAVLCTIGGTPVLAQLQSGRIVGTIFDTQKSGIPGATVVVTNVATNLMRTAVTDSQGNYVVTPLDP